MGGRRGGIGVLSFKCAFGILGKSVNDGMMR